MTHEFDGRTAIVTGASRGIGLAIAQRLVDDGARVVITGRTVSTLIEAVQTLGGPERTVAVAGRADDVAHHEETLARAVESFGSADLLVNNTGINPTYWRMIELDPDIARKIVNVNCIAALAWTQAVYQAWTAKHGGVVVNVASVAAIRAVPGIGMYGASKAMLAHMTEDLAVELGPDIRVNAVAPAIVKTTFATALYEGREQTIALTYPLKRLGSPEDIGSVVAFPLSDDASWMTGQLLVVEVV